MYVDNGRRVTAGFGDTIYVVLPWAAQVDVTAGRIAVYDRAADTVTCLAYAQADEPIVYVKENALE